MKLITDLDIYTFRQGLPRWCAVFMPFIYLTTWPVVCYRFQHWVFFYVKIPIIRQILMLLGYFLKVLVVIITGITISHRSSIGKGLFIAHIGNIVISHHTKIGDYCSIHQGVTCGGAGRGDNYGGPTIGDHVFIGANACILGKISIGNEVVIGANALIVKDVKDKSVMAAPLAQEISKNGSSGTIHYRKIK